MATSKTILIVDDSEADQLLYQRSFKDAEDYLLVAALSAEAGLSALDEAQPDLILLDYNLPDMDGLTFMARLAERRSHSVPVIMLTGEGSESVAVSAMKHGAADYLVKHMDGRHLKFLPVIINNAIRENEAREARKAVEKALSREREFIAAVLDTAGALIVVLDRECGIVRFNKQSEAVTGYRAEELAGELFWDRLIVEDERPRVRQSLEALLAGGSPMRRHNRWRTKQGELRFIRWENTVLKDEHGAVEFVIITGIDVTEAAITKNKLRLAANVFHNVAEGIIVTDPDGMIISANPASCAISGFQLDELIGQNPRAFKSNRHSAAFYKEMWEKLCNEGSWQGEIWNRRKNNGLFLCNERITAIRDDRGIVNNYVLVFSDITESRRQEEFIRHQAYHDPLTDLPNRALFTDRLQCGLDQAKRNLRHLALMFIDLDNFKDVNDDYGHEVGDLLLVEVARRITGSVREVDTVARLGGDEFTVILVDLANFLGVAAVAEKILAQLAQPMKIKECRVQVSCCIGVALYPNDGEDVKTMMERADAAMYRVKQAGKSGYAISSGSAMTK